MAVYFDSSALFKLVMVEDGSDLARSIWSARAQRVASPLAYAEVRAALAAAARASRLSGARLRAGVVNFDRIWDRISSLSLDEQIARRAGHLAERHALRGPDAVHLASALSIEGPDVIIATWDRALSRAASAAGCAVVP